MKYHCSTILKYQLRTYYIYFIFLTIHPFEAFNDTARLLFIVDSKYFPALKSQNNMIPMPVPIVSILPLNDTERIPQPLFRDGMFLIFYKIYYLVKNHRNFVKKLNQSAWSIYCIIYLPAMCEHQVNLYGLLNQLHT